MKLLLDECIPRKLKKYLRPHECKSVPEAGFAGKKNGVLLTLAEAAGFDVLVTIDEGIEYEQNHANRAMAIIIIRAKSNRLADISPSTPSCLRALKTIAAGQIVRV